ncbi:MAG: amidohydrolase family protein [Woeseia sp.]|nr:amidohydrolase family protein [Woeseia sp.]
MNRSLAIVVLVLLSFTAAADTFVLRGATIHTVGPAGTLTNADIVVENGIIREVGSGADAPAGATEIDARGRIITPGLFSPMGQIGVTEVNAVAGTVDFVQRGDAFTASFDLADAFNPRSTLVAVNRIEGITHAAVTPAGSRPDDAGNVSHVLSGLGAIVDLSGDPQSVIKPRAMLVVNLGERGSQLAGGSRAAALLQFQNALDDAIDYANHKTEFDSGARRAYSVSRADLEALQDVLQGRIPVLAMAERASDIRKLLELAATYSLRLIVAGGSEAWMLADEIANANVGVILNAAGNLPNTFDELNARMESAALLVEAGVSVSFGGDRQVINHNARNITQAAGIAVANGLTWEAALRAITLTPAEFFGVADRVGSIEVGKVADLVIWKDDPLELTSFPLRVFIRGDDVPLQSRQTLLRDRYLDPDNALPPVYRR